jgi:hypothetical protein
MTKINKIESAKAQVKLNRIVNISMVSLTITIIILFLALYNVTNPVLTGVGLMSGLIGILGTLMAIKIKNKFFL